MSNETALTKNEGAEVVVEKERPVRVYRPVVDIFEQDEAFILEAEMPGVKAENLNITVDKGLLTFEGRMSDEMPAGFEPVYSEMPHGLFRRSFKLSDAVDRDGITAELNHGLLKLTMPKLAKAMPRQIEIKAG
ncbi:MAG: Hsp20/alpha crystallin family protein [Anaerolineales bacterium]|nr:Hsp20/alpha crystallin family protein [Anaerolineales bacterium]MCB0011513.1 Hsp20/alpha crystallin family protein [Anaerolineales bacterium]MCB0016570.1 Hsp20/alpha crystallin family protein [Anaerolineales bacterium]MCB8962648.1 Hsp20/alpha crystallin family protein [Ardenticatenales bacterium]